MFQEDYILRQIEMLGAAVGKVLFNKEKDPPLIVRDTGIASDADLLQQTLLAMANDGKIAEAEDLLFESLEEDPSQPKFHVALAFYDALRRMTDEQLREGNFSREEISQGLEDVRRVLERDKA